jgi:alpha-L-rhamnosidase
LASRGHADLAYEVLTQPDYPGYGFMLSHGATTLWELWQERTGPEMNSHNHHMFASAGAFLYNVLAGINRGDGVAYSDVRFEPELVHGVNWASASIRSIHGQVASSWSRIGGGYRLKITIPVGSTAQVYLPLLKLSNPEIKESGTTIFTSGNAANGDAGVSTPQVKGGTALCTVGSGTYEFLVQERGS